MKKHFIDNSVAPIIAIDFDGTICVGNSYPDPHNGDIRDYAADVINFLHDIGVKVVIWTNRKNVPGTDIKDKLLMKQWLDDMHIKYDAVNTSTEFASYKYYGRKLYAHMFVDDRGFGWNEDKDVMINVLGAFISNILGCPDDVVRGICNDIAANRVVNMVDMQYVKDAIANWNK